MKRLELLINLNGLNPLLRLCTNKEYENKVIGPFLSD